MKYNEEAKSLTCWRASEVSQVTIAQSESSRSQQDEADLRSGLSLKTCSAKSWDLRFRILGV